MRILCAALAAFLCVAPAAAQDAGAWDARLTAATGDVAVFPPGGGEAAAGTAGLPLDEGDRVEVGAGGSAEISLDGGSLITLGENSTFTLEKTAKSESVFFLSMGSLLAKIQALGGDRLAVRTPTTVAAVRGTEFGVETGGEEESSVGVFDEGRVEVSGSGQTQVLNANQETTVSRGRGPLRPYALRRFRARRAAMRAQLKRLAAVRRGWKSLSGEKRREMRRQFLQRRREKRVQRRSERRERRQERRPRRPGAGGRRR